MPTARWSSRDSRSAARHSAHGVLAAVAAARPLARQPPDTGVQLPDARGGARQLVDHRRHLAPAQAQAEQGPRQALLDPHELRGATRALGAATPLVTAAEGLAFGDEPADARQLAQEATALADVVLRGLALLLGLVAYQVAQPDLAGSQPPREAEDMTQADRRRERGTQHTVLALLDALGDRDLAFARQQGRLAHLAQVQAHRVAPEGIGDVVPRGLLLLDDVVGDGLDVFRVRLVEGHQEIGGFLGWFGRCVDGQAKGLVGEDILRGGRSHGHAPHVRGFSVRYSCSWRWAASAAGASPRASAARSSASRRPRARRSRRRRIAAMQSASMRSRSSSSSSRRRLATRSRSSRGSVCTHRAAVLLCLRDQPLGGCPPGRMLERREDVGLFDAPGDLGVGGHELDQELLGSRSAGGRWRPRRGRGRRRQALGPQQLLRNAEGLRSHGREDVELVRIAHALQQARDLARGVRPPADGVAVGPGDIPQPRLHQRLGAVEQRLHGLGTARAHEGVGILAGRQEHAAAPQPRFDEDREAARRGSPARRVAVEAGDHAFREATEHAQLVGGEGGPERRDDLRDARLGERDEVEVSLDHHHATALADGVAGEAEPVERAALVEDRRLGRVEVLRRRVAGRRRSGKDAAPERHHATAQIGDREDEAIAEAVDEAARRAPHHQAGGDRVVERQRLRAQVAREVVAATRGVAEPEALHGLGTDAALGEVGPAACALRSAQRATEERRGRLADRHQRLRRRSPARGLLGHREPEALGHAAHRLGKDQRLRLHDEGEDVAVLAAAEAVVETAFLADRERRGLLDVERTQADRGAPAPSQRDGVGHDFEEAGALADRPDRGVADAASHGRLRSLPAPRQRRGEPRRRCGLPRPASAAPPATPRCDDWGPTRARSVRSPP